MSAQYQIKKVSELQPSDVLAHGATVSKPAEWFPGGWRSRPHWSVEVNGDPTQIETYKPYTAEALIRG